MTQIKQTNHESADEPELGTVVQVYRPWRWWIGVVVFLPILCVALLFANQVREQNLFLGLYPAFVGTLAGVTMLSAFCWLCSLNQAIVIYENGCVIKSFWRSRACSWKTIDKVYFKMVTNFNRQFYLITTDGLKITLPTLVFGKFAVYELIVNKIYPRLRQQMRAMLAAGKKVKFGKELAISKDGVRVEKHFFNWAEVRKIFWKVEQYESNNTNARTSTLFFDTVSGEKKLRTAEIPNVPALLKLLKSDYKVTIKKETDWF